MLDFVGKRRFFFLLSLLFIVPGIISLLVPPGLRPGIEFTGGSTLDVTFARPVTQAEVRSELAVLGHDEAIIQQTGEGGRSYFIRTRELAKSQEGGGEVEQVRKALENLAPIEKSEFFSVSPIVAVETVRNAFIAVVAAAVGILLYITWAFRHVPSPFRYGVCAILALLHDVAVVVGLFSLLGRFLLLEVDALFITGVLTVIGYSVHDTIVVFDRIRENVSRSTGRSFDLTVNVSILETLGRSLNTSLTLVFTLLALILFGGPTIFNFLLVLLIGIISGTYSSVCIASQLLVVWEKGELRGLWRRVPFLAPAR